MKYDSKVISDLFTDTYEVKSVKGFTSSSIDPDFGIEVGTTGYCSSLQAFFDNDYGVVVFSTSNEDYSNLSSLLHSSQGSWHE